jgi:hypothetical protein
VARFFGRLRVVATLLLCFGGQAVLAAAAQASPTWTFAVTGDFNGDGKTDIAQFDASTGEWWVRQSTGSRFTSRVWTSWNPTVHWGDVVAGDFNGDGKTDIAAMDLDSGQWWAALSTGSSFTNSLWGTWSPAVTWDDVRVGDFDGDGKADIAGRADSTGQWFVAQSTGTRFTSSQWTTWNPSVKWDDVVTGDFNGDGKTDIAGRVDSTGQWFVAQSTGTSFSNSQWTAWSPSVKWDGVRVGDFDGDGKADIAGRIDSSGQWWVAQSTGTSFSNSPWATWSPSVKWDDVVTGDFDGDGTTDIAGRIDSSGQWFVGLSNRQGFVSGQWTTWSPAVTWGPVLAGDFGGDGKADLAGFDAASGQWWVAISNGSSFSNSLWSQVVNPPTIAEAFSAATIPIGGTTTMTFTVTNPNDASNPDVATGLSGVGFTDVLPAGLVVSTTPNLSNGCGGTATAAAGSSSVSLSGGRLNPAASCVFSVDVQGTSAGAKNSSVTVTSTEGGLSNSASATLTVVGSQVTGLSPVNTSPPAVSGTAAVGGRLTSSPGGWSGDSPISYGYQWMLCQPGCSPISGANSAGYMLTAADLGTRIAVTVTATNSAGSATAISAAIGPVKASKHLIGLIIAALANALALPRQVALTAELLRGGGYAASFSAPAAGRLVISWYLVPNGARLARTPKPTLVARGSVTVKHPGRVKVNVRLTKPGHQLLTRQKRLLLTAKGSFTPAGGTATSATHTIALKR